MSNSNFRSIRAFGGFAAVVALDGPGDAGTGSRSGISSQALASGLSRPPEWWRAIRLPVSRTRARMPQFSSPRCRRRRIPRSRKRSTPEALRKQGISLEKREPMRLSVGKAFLLTGRQVADKERYRKWLLVAAAGNLTALVSVQIPEQDSSYPDRIVRAALATLSVRATVPEAEELGLLPFTVGDLAGFHVDDVLRGRALVLSDAPAKVQGFVPMGPRSAANRLDAHLLIAAVPGGPAEPDDRANFARLAFNEIAGIRERPRHDVRAAAHRRSAGISDHGGGQGCAHRNRCHGGAVAALRQRRVSANDRHRARRHLDDRTSHACARCATASTPSESA